MKFLMSMILFVAASASLAYEGPGQNVNEATKAYECVKNYSNHRLMAVIVSTNGEKSYIGPIMKFPLTDSGEKACIARACEFTTGMKEACQN